MERRNRIRQLIWLYFWLLILEGALRRWALPSLAGPLLLVREPVAIALLALALRGGLLRRLPMVALAWGVTLFSLTLSLVFAHGNVFIALYGARIALLHFPLIFVIARAFDISDVLRMGRACVIVAIPMTLLIAAQFHLPQSHFINIGIGGEGTAGFSSNTGRFRPPGTFSFTLGITQFYSLVGAFLVSFAAISNVTRRWWWIAAAVATAVAVPLSISRGLLFQLMITGAFLIAAGTVNPRLAPRIILSIALLASALLVATFIPSFQTAMEAFSTRWATANESEGGMVAGVFVDRFLGGLWSALTNVHTIPFAGFGLGLGTNAGAALLSGDRAFLIAEGEWLRIVGEMGPVLGLGFIGIRIAVVIGILRHAVRSWIASNPVPLILGSVAVVWVAQSQWAQPTALGFSVLAGGLALAANRRPQSMPAQSGSRKPAAEIEETSHGQ